MKIFVQVKPSDWKLSFDFRLEEELERSSHHASANVDLHVYAQRLENECRDLRCQLTLRDKEKLELNDLIADLEIQVNNSLCSSKEIQFMSFLR